jgi:hypothetical protein
LAQLIEYYSLWRFEQGEARNFSLQVRAMAFDLKSPTTDKKGASVMALEPIVGLTYYLTY